VSTATIDIPDVADSWPLCDHGVRRIPTIRSIRVPDDEEWSLVGEPLRDLALRERVVSALNEVATLPGFDNVGPLGDDRDFNSIQAALNSAYDHLAEVSGTNLTRIGPASSDLVALLTEIGHLQLSVARAQARQRNDRYAATRSALSRLRGVDSVEQMLERAPAELSRCGFDRAIVSRIEESTWWVESVHVKGDAEWASEIARVGRAHPMHIDHMLVESEIMRRRAPVLVRDAQHERRTNAVIGQVSLSRSYVAAPIMPDGRVIGLLHADCYVSRRHVDDEDLAVLWMFAEGFGYAFQRTALSERLRSARNEIQRMARGIGTAADDLCTAHTVLGRPQAPADGLIPPPPVAASLAPDSAIESLLSRREIEVVALMAQGKSNGAIATHLVISEGTVKTHVKHILRKLKASNRAEAVFRYMRMTAVQGTPPAVQRRSQSLVP
jgi:LuxR family transcriptional regulator, regulator of acetate metabolism